MAKYLQVLRAVANSTLVIDLGHIIINRGQLYQKEIILGAHNLFYIVGLIKGGFYRSFVDSVVECPIQKSFYLGYIYIVYAIK